MKKHPLTKTSQNGGTELLSRSVPRRVRLTAGGFTVALMAALFVICGLIVGPVLNSKASGDRTRIDRLIRESIEAEAEVVRVEITRGENPRRIVHFAYTADGETRRGQARLRKRDRHSIELGSRISIRHSGGKSWLPGYEPTGTPLALAFAVPGGLMIIAVLLAWLVKREWRLLENGRATLGVVTRHQSKSQGCRVHYEYHVMSGALRRAHFDTEKKNDAPAAGTRLVIVYHRDDTHRHARYPLALVKYA